MGDPNYVKKRKDRKNCKGAGKVQNGSRRNEMK